MAKWTPHTITRGPLAGQYFVEQMAYMNARARHLGFSTYAAERAAKTNPAFVYVMEKARNRGESRSDSIQTAKRIVGDKPPGRSTPGTHVGTSVGQRMSEIIKAIYDEGYYDSGDDVADEIFY